MHALSVITSIGPHHFAIVKQISLYCGFPLLHQHMLRVPSQVFLVQGMSSVNLVCSFGSRYSTVQGLFSNRMLVFHHSGIALP